MQDLVNSAQLGVHVHVDLEDLNQGLHVGGGQNGLAGGVLVGEGLDAVLGQHVHGDVGGILGTGGQSTVSHLGVIKALGGHVVASHGGNQLGTNGGGVLGGHDLVGQLIQLSGGQTVLLGDDILADDIALGNGRDLASATGAGGENTAHHGQKQETHDDTGQDPFGNSCVSFHFNVSFVLIGDPGKGSRGAAPRMCGRCVQW